MSIRGNHLISLAVFLGTLLPAAAQSGAIDPALLARANAGDPAAQVAVADEYAQAAATEHDKMRMTDDYQQEFKWYRKAAEQNYIGGEMGLAALYRDGGDKSIPRDMEQAAAWYRKAADQGDPTAQATLGLLYSMGQGVSHDDVEAYFWLDLAASVKGPNQAKVRRQLPVDRRAYHCLSTLRCRGSRGRLEGRTSSLRRQLSFFKQRLH